MNSNLKPFKLTISGTFTEVPSQNRMMEVTAKSDEDFELTNLEILVIAHECLCRLRNDMQKEMSEKQIDEVAKKFHKYYFGETDHSAEYKEVMIEMSGKYSDVPNSGRYIEIGWIKDGLTKEEVSIILFDAVCLTRNMLSKSMSREELSEFAEKHKIYNFGMLKNEKPFETR